MVKIAKFTYPEFTTKAYGKINHDIVALSHAGIPHPEIAVFMCSEFTMEAYGKSHDHEALLKPYGDPPPCNINMMIFSFTTICICNYWASGLQP